jgi:RHS repeat-associated protein
MHSVSLKFLVGILSYSDYYPFGMQMPGRNASTGDYRYGFQGQETDDEVTGSESHVSYKYRMHDARLGRFLSIDPLAAKYPHNSPYAFSENIVIHLLELEGLETSKTGNDYDPLSPVELSGRFAESFGEKVKKLRNIITNPENNIGLPDAENPNLSSLRSIESLALRWDLAGELEDDTPEGELPVKLRLQKVVGVFAPQGEPGEEAKMFKNFPDEAEELEVTTVKPEYQNDDEWTSHDLNFRTKLDENGERVQSSGYSVIFKNGDGESVSAVIIFVFEVERTQ